MPEQIGFIGLGIMGRPMALNLLRAGYPLAVHARRAESMAPLVAAGASACASAAEVARRASLIFTMVADTPDVEAVILGRGPGAAGAETGAETGTETGAEPGATPGNDPAVAATAPLIAGLQPGTLVIDMSTIAPAAARAIGARLRAAGADLLDAPVSGGEAGAIDGTLSIMVGGSEAAFARALPLLQVLGRNIVHIGGPGAGQVCKACNQIVVAATMAGIGEALQLAAAAGVDGARVRTALLGGFAGSRILEVHGQRMLDGAYRPGFKASLHQKDMRIVLETAAALGLALPGAAQVAQYLNALVGQGQGELDSAAIHLVQQWLNGGAPPAGD